MRGTNFLEEVTNMTKKLRTSLIVILSIVVLIMSVGLLSINQDWKTYANGDPANEIAIVTDKSGASIKMHRPETGTSFEGIRFTFELVKTDVDAKFTTGEGEVTAEMLVIPTDILTLKGATAIRKDDQNLYNESSEPLFASYAFDGEWSTTPDGNYKFVATLYSIPKNAYDYDVTAVLCFTKGETVEYSNPLSRSMRYVARIGYDNEIDESKKELIADYLKYYENESATGTNFTITYDNGVDQPIVENQYLYGDTLTATGVGESAGGWVDSDGNYFATTDAIKQQTVSKSTTYTAVNMLGEIVTDGTDYSSPEGVSDLTKIVSTTNGKVYYDYNNGGFNVETEHAQTITDNDKVTDTALVYDGSELLGISTVSVVTKVINDVDDLSSLYITRKTLQDLGLSISTDNAKANSVKGYFYVSKDIENTTDFKANSALTYSGGASYFQGKFDGNGKTIEYGLADTVYGYASLFGTLYDGAVVKNASFVIDSVPTTNKGAYALAAMIISSGYNEDHRPLVENVFIRFDTEIDIAAGDIGKYGVSFKTFQADFKNVVMDLSNFKGVKEALAGDSSLSYGVFSVNNQKIYNGSAVGKYENCYIITDVPYIAHHTTNSELAYVRFAQNDSELFDAYKVGHADDTTSHLVTGLTRFNDYADAKAYFAKTENAEMLSIFEKFADTSLGFPFEGDKQAFVDSTAVLTVGGENKTEFDLNVGENADLSVVLNYLGQEQQINVQEVSDDSEIITVSANTIYYVAGKAGTATVSVTATIDGVSYSKTITISVSVPVLTGTLYHDGEGEEPFLLPASITGHDSYNASTLKVVDKSDSSVIIQDGANVLVTQISREKITKNAYVYCGETLLGEVEVVCVAKFISKVSDMSVFYNTWSDTSIGEGKYYLVVSDIYYTDGNGHMANPHYPESTFYREAHTGSQAFIGVFDGNGHTIEYAVSGGGLFGSLRNGAVIKNATLVVKDVDLTSTKADKYSAIAGYTYYWPDLVLVQDVYVKYDLPEEKCSPDIVGTGIGLFGNANGLALTNVVVDMSCITGIKDKIEADTEKTGNVGVFGARMYGDVVGVTTTNCYVIWDNPYIKYANFKYTATTETPINIIATATGENTEGLLSGATAIKGVTRINALTDVSSDIAVGDYYKITSSGVVRNA